MTRQSQVPLSVPEPPVESSVSAGMVEVHVSGWVVAPGVVTVPDGAIVADVVMAAGGLVRGADTTALNLAAPVRSGDQIIVPGPGETAAGPTNTSGGRLSLSRASASELETLPGVGSVTAGRIVAFREENGPFREVEDLLQVPGIGEAKLAAIRDLVTP